MFVNLISKGIPVERLKQTPEHLHVQIDNLDISLEVVDKARCPETGPYERRIKEEMVIILCIFSQEKLILEYHSIISKIYLRDGLQIIPKIVESTIDYEEFNKVIINSVNCTKNLIGIAFMNLSKD